MIERHRRISSLDHERTRRTIEKLQAAPDVTEAWHRMAEPLTDPHDDGLDGARGIGRGLAIGFGFGVGVLVALWLLL